MKRWLMWGLVVLVAASASFAARKKEAAGVVKDKVYQDSEYGFQFKIHENWSAKVNKADLNSRVVLIQKNWAVPPQYSQAKDYTQIPHLVVYADTSSLSAKAFIDSLLSETYKSKAKKEILKEFEFLSLPDIVVKGGRALTVAGQTAFMWNAEYKYVKEIQETASSIAGIRVAGGYSGMMLAIKNGNIIVLYHLMCENNFFNEIAAEVRAMSSDDGALSWVKAGD
jgi:hypothetical protein